MSKRGGFPGMGGFGGMNINQLNERSKKNASRYGKITRRISKQRI